MSPNKLKITGIVVLPGVVLATVIVIQREALRALREDNLAQRRQLAQLTAESKDLSNQLFRATVTQPPQKDPLREEPPRELLRLRGEVGVLRRQLQELRELTSRQSPRGPQDSAPRPAASAETSRKIEDLRLRGQDVYVPLKGLSDQLQEKASDGKALLQAIIENGLQDNLLSSLLEQRQVAAQKLLALQTDPGGAIAKT